MEKQLRSGVASRSWSWLLRNVVLPVGDAATSQGMMKRLRFLENAQWWGQDQVLDWQDQRLRELMSTAWEVPFYRELMQSANLRPEDFQHARDLQKLPVVTKDMMRSAYPSRITRNTSLKTYETCSSGSTGTNFFVREDAATAGVYRATFLLALQWAGWTFGEPHMQTGMGRERRGARALKDAILRCHYISTADLTNEHLDMVLDRLEDSRIRHLWGYPASLFVLATRAKEKGWNLPLKSVVTWGDNLFPHYRERIESVFRTRVFDTYGCGEGFQVAAQCGTGRHYHLQAFDTIIEFLDDDGSPVREGSLGHVIVTRLHPGPMPLIRYRVGDVAIPGPAAGCPCGRGMPLMASVQGRDTDVVVTGSGNRLVVHFFTGVLEYFHEIRHFQVIQEEASSMVIRLVPSHPGGIDDEVKRRIVSALRERGATGIVIDIEVVDEIPVAASGKRRFVISKLGSGHFSPVKTRE